MEGSKPTDDGNGIREEFTHTWNASLKYSVRDALFLACHVQSVFSGTRQETISLLLLPEKKIEQF